LLIRVRGERACVTAVLEPIPVLVAAVTVLVRAGIATVADRIAVAISLVEVWHERTVIEGVVDAIPVGVRRRRAAQRPGVDAGDRGVGEQRSFGLRRTDAEQRELDVEGTADRCDERVREVRIIEDQLGREMIADILDREVDVGWELTDETLPVGSRVWSSFELERRQKCRDSAYGLWQAARVEMVDVGERWMRYVGRPDRWTVRGRRQEAVLGMDRDATGSVGGADLNIRNQGPEDAARLSSQVR